MLLNIMRILFFINAIAIIFCVITNRIGIGLILVTIELGITVYWVSQKGTYTGRHHIF